MKLATVLAMATVTVQTATAALTLGTPFSDGAVLQRGLPIPVWGWADAGQPVTVALAGKKATATTAADGRWKAVLPALPAGGPYELVVSGPNEIRLQDVFIGEVWICSGQSNMDMELQTVLDAGAHIAGANFPNLRIMEIVVESAPLPRDRLTGTAPWRVCSPNNAPAFSAVAYFFGRELVRTLDVPVGLIVVATGATPIELWIPREGLDTVPALAPMAAEARQADDAYRAALAANPATPPVHPYMVADNPQRGLGTLFNGSVVPVVGYAMRGMIWYQGESNRGDSSVDYLQRHQALLNGWRHVWGLGDPSTGSGQAFPFYYVQISPLEAPWRPDWQIPEIWEAQRMLLQMPNTGMAVIHDLCEDLKKIHPQNKEGVGQRLALWALAKTYGVKDLPYSGPIFKSHTVEGARIRIQFEHAQGLKSRDGKPLDWFSIAGADGNFVPAQAQVDKDTVVVWSDAVPEPKDVALGWTSMAQPNLVNGAGLPTSQFRSNRPR